MAGAIEDYAIWVTAAGGSRESLRVRRSYLLRLARANPNPWTVTGEDLLRFQARDGWAPETRKAARSAMRSFYQWAHKAGHVTVDPSADLPRVVAHPGRPRPTPEVILARALQLADQRERRMLMLAGYQGLRRAETARVHARDIFGDMLLVHGKGGKQRDVPLHPIVAAELGSHRQGWLFPGKIDGHLSPDRVGRIVAGLLDGQWTMHTLRHRFLTRAYSADRDLRAVQELAGHARVETTMVYTEIPDGALLRAVLAAGPVAS